MCIYYHERRFYVLLLWLFIRSMFLFRIVNFMKERKMKDSNIIILSDDQKRYYINYLNEINEALKAYEERNVIQVNNNSQVNSNSSNGTTVSGFVDHEPDTSFKYIRNNNSDSNWI